MKLYEATTTEESARGVWRRLFLDDASWILLTAIAGAVVAGSAWLLASPDWLLSRQMTWDMLFNLSGAWYLHNGLAAHVDFHDPLGTLSFRLTAIGFWFTGPSVWAFIAGECVVTAGLFVTATAVAARRLPLVPAAMFVAFVCLLVLMPVNVGERVTDYTFAMDYNAMGWAMLCVLSLLLFVPPRVGPMSDWLDLAVAGVLIAGMYVLKITYFGTAIVELGVAVCVCEHLRRRWRLWSALAAVMLLNAVAPYNWPYLRDIFTAVGTGAANSDPLGVIVVALANAPELSLMMIGAMVCLTLWHGRVAPARLPVGAILFIVAGVGVLTQNTQARGLPLSVVLIFLLYDHFRGDPRTGRPAATSLVLLTLLILPLAGLTKQTASLVAYHRHAINGSALYAFERPALRGLVIPREEPGLLEAVSTQKFDPGLFTRIRTVDTDEEELSQFEYAQTIEEAAALFDDPARRSGGIVLFDQVNPLPFILGRAPPRGVTLWLHPAFPWQPAERMLGDAKYVLVPKFSTFRTVTDMALDRYGSYLAAHFPQRIETRYWILLSRSP